MFRDCTDTEYLYSTGNKTERFRYRCTSIRLVYSVPVELLG